MSDEMQEIILRVCPFCGKEPNVIRKTINGKSCCKLTCKPFLRKDHLSLSVVRDTFQEAFEVAAKKWNKIADGDLTPDDSCTVVSYRMKPSDYFNCGYNLAMKHSKSFLGEPTPVKHSYWFYPYPDKDINKCHACGFCVQDKISNVREMFRFCPRCGAEMVGDPDE